MLLRCQEVLTGTMHSEKSSHLTSGQTFLKKIPYCSIRNKEEEILGQNLVIGLLFLALLHPSIS